MTTNAEIRDQLEAIDTGIYYTNNDKKKELKMDNFSSFVYCKSNFPENKDLQKKLDKSKSSFKPKQISKGIDFAFDDSFFDLDNDFNNEFMLLGLNVAARGSDEIDEKGNIIKGANLSDWQNFHDKERITNTCKLFVQLNNKHFKGCYITDLIKNAVDSNAGHISRDLFLSSNEPYSFIHNDEKAQEKRLEIYKKNYGKDAQDKLKSNEEIFNTSVRIFVKECNIIKPKHLAVFGGDAYKALKRFKETNDVKENDANSNNINIGKLIDDAVWLEHYSGYNKTFDKWFEEQPSEHIPDYVPKLNLD